VNRIRYSIRRASRGISRRLTKPCGNGTRTAGRRKASRSLPCQGRTDEQIDSGVVRSAPGNGDRPGSSASFHAERADLVISSDTSTVHLAGALGKPVWILLHFVPDWRWMLDRSDSPWYPTARLFRQPERGDWAAVVAEVGRELETWFVAMQHQRKNSDIPF
jgi:hypothetical protein